MDQINSGQVNTYHLSGVSGHLEIHTLAYGLYSPIHPSPTLYDKEGNIVLSTILDPVYIGDSGYQNQDVTLMADNLPYGDYTLKITAERVSAGFYPAGPIALDKVPFILVSGSINEESSSLGQIPNNARCRQDENFPKYSSPVGPPPKTKTFLDENQTGFCSTIRDDSDDSSHPPGGGTRTPDMGAIIGWLLPWTFMMSSILAFRFVIRLRTFSQEANL